MRDTRGWNFFFSPKNFVRSNITSENFIEREILFFWEDMLLEYLIFFFDRQNISKLLLSKHNDNLSSSNNPHVHLIKKNYTFKRNLNYLDDPIHSSEIVNFQDEFDKIKFFENIPNGSNLSSTINYTNERESEQMYTRSFRPHYPASSTTPPLLPSNTRYNSWPFVSLVNRVGVYPLIVFQINSYPRNTSGGERWANAWRTTVC